MLGLSVGKMTLKDNSPPACKQSHEHDKAAMAEDMLAVVTVHWVA